MRSHGFVLYKTGIHWNKDWNLTIVAPLHIILQRIRPESTEIRIETPSCKTYWGMTNQYKTGIHWNKDWNLAES